MIKVSFQDAWMEKKMIFHYCPLILCKFWKLVTYRLYQKEKKQESYMTLTQGRRSTKEITPALSEVRPNT